MEKFKKKDLDKLPTGAYGILMKILANSKLGISVLDTIKQIKDDAGFKDDPVNKGRHILEALEFLVRKFPNNRKPKS